MGSQIRYLAIVSEHPDTLARFYSTHFAMRELGRSDAGTSRSPMAFIISRYSSRAMARRSLASVTSGSP